MWLRRIGRRLAAKVAASPFAKIGVFAASAHLLLLFVFCLHHLATPPTPSKRPIAVRMHRPPPPPQPKRQPPVQQRAAPKKAQPKPTPVPKKAPAPTLKPKRKPIPEIKLPSLLEKSPVETVVEAKDDLFSFSQILASALQAQLQLPEIGEVRARIVLFHPGRIGEVEILDARSIKNSEWLKNQLPCLSIPCFTDFGIKDAKLELTITFKNAEKI